jgi:hypothetical protein
MRRSGNQSFTPAQTQAPVAASETYTVVRDVAASVRDPDASKASGASSGVRDATLLNPPVSYKLMRDKSCAGYAALMGVSGATSPNRALRGSALQPGFEVSDSA